MSAPTSVWLAVAAGGALGAVARHAAVQAVATRFARPEPFAVLGVNVVGCFAIGIVWSLLERGGAEPGWLRPLLVTGFLGGFTTYSAFGKETVDALQAGRAGVALANVVLHVALGLLAVAAGRSLL